MTHLEILIKARALISEPRNWLQNYSRKGNQRCAVEAIREIEYGTESSAKAHEMLRDQALKKGYRTTTIFNDSTNHPTVLAAFDAAIEKARTNYDERR